MKARFFQGNAFRRSLYFSKDFWENIPKTRGDLWGVRHLGGWRDLAKSGIWRTRFWGLFLLSAFLFSSCAIAPSVPPLQPTINSLVVANRMSLAADKISAQEADYGPGNYLLYYLDRGLVGFYAGRYQESIWSFEKAKQRFEELYTKSLSKEGMTWLLNDNAAPYYGSDYEYVLVNVFQALNFLQLGDLNEALVEARDLSAKYQVVDGLAQKVKRRHFEDNGFARLFMGLILQAAGGGENESEALLFYKEALTQYRQFYAGSYVPRVLGENLLKLARKFGDEDYVVLQSELRGVAAPTERPDQAQLIVIHLVGYSPLKVPEIIPVPLDRELITKITFPKFIRRYYAVRSARITAENDLGWRTSAETELGSDIEDLAIKDLGSRKVAVLAKAILRPALKYLVERKQKETIEKRHGETTADVFGLLSNIYNFVSEQADLRSWQSLPAQIRVARLFLSAGHYKLTSDGLGEDGALIGVDKIGEVELRSGETRFSIIRSPR
jgi:uncharacterized protein